MKQEQGLVIEVHDGMARIKVGRHEECTGCGACPSSRHVMVEAVNRVGAQPGQRVRFELREQHMLLGAFVVFVLPLLAAGAGAVLGWLIGPGAGVGADYAAPAGAAALFVLSLPAVKYFDRRAGRNQELKPVILEILDD